MFINITGNACSNYKKGTVIQGFRVKERVKHTTTIKAYNAKQSKLIYF
jgi:hypothetical protein